MRNGVGGVAIQVAWNQRHTAENVLYWADVKRWHLFRSPLVQHGHPFLLHAAVRSQADWFEGAEENQGEYHVRGGIVHPTSGAQGAIEEEKRSRVPNITPASDIHVGNMIKIL